MEYCLFNYHRLVLVESKARSMGAANFGTLRSKALFGDIWKRHQPSSTARDLDAM
jgi:hypothetical protein